MTAEDIVHQKNKKPISVTHDALIKDALQIMLDNKIGTMLVKKNGNYIGFWTERDLMRNINIKNFDIETSIIGDYVIADINIVSHNDTIYQLFDKFIGKGVRYMLVQKDGEYIGLLSRGDVIRASLYEKNETLKGVNAIVNWEYYSKWHWK